MAATRPRLFIIWLTVFIDLVGWGIVIPILPFASARFGVGGLGYGSLVGAFSFMQFLSTALLGRLSDRVGRRPILLTTMVLNAAGYLLFAFAPSFLLLLLARLVAGFAGGNISAAQAYVADITTAEDRSKGMGLIGMAFGLGFILGPGIGVVASHFGGPAGPGLVAMALSIVNFISAYFILPESLREEHRANRELWPFGHMAQALAHPELRPLMLVWAITPFAFAAYTVALPLWSPAGNRLAFVRGHDAHIDVCLINADGSRFSVLVADAISPCWSADGRWIYFGRVPHGIAKVEVQSGDVTPVRRDAVTGPIYSHDGAAFFFALLFLFLLVEEQPLGVLEGSEHRGRDRLALGVVLAILREFLEALEIGVFEQSLQRGAPQALVDARLEKIPVFGGKTFQRIDRRELRRHRRRRWRVRRRRRLIRHARGVGLGLGRLRVGLPRLFLQPRPARNEPLVSGHRASHP